MTKPLSIDIYIYLSIYKANTFSYFFIPSNKSPAAVAICEAIQNVNN